VLAKGDSGSWSWQIRYNAPEGNYVGFHANGEIEGPTWVSVKQTLIPGEWYHTAARYNGSHTSMYLNGVETESKPLSGIHWQRWLEQHIRWDYRRGQDIQQGLE
jgi:hypothetical protein